MRNFMLTIHQSCLENSMKLPIGTKAVSDSESLDGIRTVSSPFGTCWMSDVMKL